MTEEISYEYQTREFSKQEPRVESGPIRFEADWTGTFIRGDESFYYAINIEQILKRREDPDFKLDFLEVVALKDLLDLLKSSREK